MKTKQKFLSIKKKRNKTKTLYLKRVDYIRNKESIQKKRKK
jgi:hypothetical protein